MGRDLEVAVVEPDDHPQRDHVVAHRVDERAAELAVLASTAERPAHRVDHPVERLRDLPHLLDPERPDLRVLAGKAEPVHRDTGQVSLRPLGEDRDLGGHVGARLEVRQRLAVAPSSLVAGAHADRPGALHEQLLRGGLREDVGAAGLRLLAHPPRELGQRRDVVPVVTHRRRRRDPKGRAPGEVVDRLVVDRPVERHVLHAGPVAEEPAQRARVDDSARQRVGADALALLEHGDRDLAEPFRGLRRLLEQLAEPDRAGEPRRACADDQHADVDPLLRRIRRRRDVLAGIERWWEICRSRAAHRCADRALWARDPRTRSVAGFTTFGRGRARSASERSRSGLPRRRGRNTRRSVRSGPC